MKTNTHLIVAAALLAGCAGVPFEDADTTRAHCAVYDFYDLPAIAEVFGTEPMPSECLPGQRKRHAKWERVVVVNGDGSYRAVMVPPGATVVAGSSTR